MSETKPPRPVRVTDILAKKEAGRKVVALTAYDAPSGAIADAAGVDLILVGDSLGNTVLGFESTVPVTMEHMAHHTAATARATRRALLVADLPFMAYKTGTETALQNCARLMQAGAAAIKMEGCDEIADTVHAATRAGMPVLGHIGLQPQSVHAVGGYRSQGKDMESAARLMREAKRLEELGCFAVVLELIQPEVAQEIGADLKIPTIGIGAGEGCDGQILVFTDLLGLRDERPPSFVKPQANLFQDATDAIRRWAKDVRGE